MNNTSGPVRQILSKASVVGVGLSIFAILLFMVLWFVLGELGLSAISRMIAALCIPPAVIAGMIGAYILWIRPATKKGD